MQIRSSSKHPWLVALAAAGFLVQACGDGGEPQDLGKSQDQVDTLLQTQGVDLQTAHPYAHRAEQTWSVEVPAEALALRVVFDRFETEYGYDFVDILDAQGVRVHHLSGNLSGGSYAVEGHAASLRFSSDGSVRAWGFAVSQVEYDLPRRPEASDHRPVCRNIGTRSEGWYWGDDGQLIRWEPCAAAPAPACIAIGSRGEGWAAGDTFITWDLCHRTVRIAIAGEPCGPSIGFSCHDGLTCQGLSEDVRGGTGTCAAPSEPRRGWVGVLVQGLESEHPYADGSELTFTKTWEAASRVQLHFQQLDLEAGYDSLTVGDGTPASEQALDGQAEDVWSQELEGGTAVLRLRSDYSVNGYGFRVDMARLYLEVPEGACSEDAHCLAGERCVPHSCFNPYAPCFGSCVLGGQGAEGDPCDATRGCAEGLACKGVGPDGAGTCQGARWCAEESAEVDCQGVDHPQMAGFWRCAESACAWVPGYRGGDFESTQAVGVPDNSAAGVTSELVTREMTSQCLMMLDVDVDLRHTYVGDLVVGLTSPTGERVLLHNRTGGGADDLHLSRVPVAISGGPNGTWTLDVSDRAAYDVGTLDGWALHFTCR
ncbi:MAG TPA: proprotein convertase P-domain-containing protein [Myxococcota bacterium]|nr:proprotein convertase P-domain-containing protein [Myxococcota bacterium]HRY94390.1 proprotein convertase P-domain-containing protein [Myxococcota bacterium]HSA19996.1 proprotein convertase P-domain-containing protein [Myxococcota bacterium]